MESISTALASCQDVRASFSVRISDTALTLLHISFGGDFSNALQKARDIRIFPVTSTTACIPNMLAMFLTTSFIS
jgi:hypothetical protein